MPLAVSVIQFSRPLTLRQSDFGPNGQLRHSAYYDIGAQTRNEILHELGITAVWIGKMRFLPAIVREECIFRAGIIVGVPVTLNTKLKALSKQQTHFSLQQEFVQQDTTCAVLNVEGTWINTENNLISTPPQIGIDAFNSFPKTTDFEQR